MNVTLGIPRLREILMTGSARIATPIAQVPFLPHVSKREAENLKRVMDKLYLKQFLKAVKIYEKTVMEAGRFNIQYIVEIHLLRRKKRDHETKHVDNARVITRIEKKLFKQIGRVIKRKLDKAYQDTKGTVKKALQMLRAGERADNTRDGENSENEQMADVDAADEIRFRKQNDETEYVGEAEEKDEIMPSDNEESSSSDESENESSLIKKELPDEDSNDEIECGAKKSKEADAARIKAVLEANPFISSYSYDADKNSWCQLTIQVSAISGSLDIASLVAEEIEKFVVQETRGIQRCILREEQNQQILQTEGINLQSFYAKAEFLNINKIGCNDIHTIARIYGIEAAASSLMNEIEMVFGGYGIHVDHRHLSLIADYMCHTGAYEPFNRMYMGTSASPFQKMSFETTTEFLKEAIFQHEVEPLTSPSSRLSVGGLVRIGTGSFDLMVDVKKI
uniref:DNA-directed RNA polymerase n=1 Tax=Romanomermis culicivorax TaxID=13658 RepID=A0A915KIM4_ROMCU